MEQDLCRFLNAGHQMKIGFELIAVFLEQSELPLRIGRHRRKPGPRGALVEQTGTIMPVLWTQCRHPQTFADAAEDFFTFTRVHRVLQ